MPKPTSRNTPRGLFHFPFQPKRGRFVYAPYLQTAVNTARNHFPNAVGYTTIAVKKNTLTAFGVQFQTLNGAKELPIASLVTVAAPQANFGLGTSDSMQVWKASEGKFTTYWYKKNVGWVENVTPSPTKPTSDTVKEGDGVYFKRTGSATDTTITISGKVNVFDPSYPITVKKNTITFLCNPWPVEFPINDFATMVGTPQANFGLGTSDSVQVWDPGTGTTAGKYTTYWNKKNVGYVENVTPVPAKATTVTIKPGAAVMFKRTGSATDTTITFPKPAGL